MACTLISPCLDTQQPPRRSRPPSTAMAMERDGLEQVRSLIESPAEVVITKGDVKLRHLGRDPRCVFVVFEAARPFRGVEIRGNPQLAGRLTVVSVCLAQNSPRRDLRP